MEMSHTQVGMPLKIRTRAQISFHTGFYFPEPPNILSFWKSNPGRTCLVLQITDLGILLVCAISVIHKKKEVKIMERIFILPNFNTMNVCINVLSFHCPFNMIGLQFWSRIRSRNGNWAQIEMCFGHKTKRAINDRWDQRRCEKLLQPDSKNW